MTPGDGTFVVRRIVEDDSIILRPRGELDMATAPALREAISEGVREAQPAKVVIDLTELSFIDCTGIGTLVDAHNEARGAGRSVVVANPGGWIRKVLDLTSTTYLVGSGNGGDGERNPTESEGRDG
jgi:anti-anti-sigma factor